MGQSSLTMEERTVCLKKLKRILLIGGCGYIGSRLYSLLSKNYNVTSVDLEWFDSFVPHNFCRDYNKLNKTFINRFDVVILLAGHSSTQMCIDNAKASYANNVGNFVNLIEKIKDTKFIYASSSSVYGNFKDRLATEKVLGFAPNNFYDLTKHIIDLHASLYPIEYYGLRLGTVNGFSESFRKDIMINAMYASYDKYGYIKEYNPEVYRPILDIKDLGRAIETIIENGSIEKAGIYNLGSFNSQVKDIVTRVSKYLNCRVEKVKGTDDTKLQSGLYNFSINSDKFRDTFSFEFKGNVKSILDDITSDRIISFSDRKVKKEYV